LLIVAIARLQLIVCFSSSFASLSSLSLHSFTLKRTQDTLHHTRQLSFFPLTLLSTSYVLSFSRSSPTSSHLAPSLSPLSRSVEVRDGVTKGKQRRSLKHVELDQRLSEVEERERGRTTWSGGGDNFEMRAREEDRERAGRVSEMRCARLATPPSLGWRRRLTRRCRLPPTLFFLLLTRDAASTSRTLIYPSTVPH
jgi:hypothetical protein